MTPNGGINRAGNNEPSIRVLRMKDSLIPLRFNDLFSAYIANRPRSSTSQILNAPLVVLMTDTTTDRFVSLGSRRPTTT